MARLVVRKEYTAIVMIVKYAGYTRWPRCALAPLCSGPVVHWLAPCAGHTRWPRCALPHALLHPVCLPHKLALACLVSIWVQCGCRVSAVLSGAACGYSERDSGVSAVPFHG